MDILYSPTIKEYFYRRIFTGITIFSGLLFIVLVYGWLSFGAVINSNITFVVLILSFLGLISSYLSGCVLIYIRFTTFKQKRKYTSGLGGKVALILSGLMQLLGICLLAIMINYFLYPGPK